MPPDFPLLPDLVEWLRVRFPPRPASAATLPSPGQSPGTSHAAFPGIIGIVGLPGCGKSTLAATLVRELSTPERLCVSVSLDDFYCEPAERRARGFPLRGPPGTHDFARLARFLDQLDQLGQSRPSDPIGDIGPLTQPPAAWGRIDLPVFDRENERRLPSRPLLIALERPLHLCIIEGWFLGARAPGYERLADALACLIYLDMDPALARAARLKREAELRQAGRGGMSDAQVARFWDEALAPSFASWVFPLRDRADVVVSLDAAHAIRSVVFKH